MVEQRQKNDTSECSAETMLHQFQSVRTGASHQNAPVGKLRDRFFFSGSLPLAGEIYQMVRTDWNWCNIVSALHSLVSLIWLLLNHSITYP